MTEPTWGETFAAASMTAMQIYEETLVGPLFTPWGRALVDDLKIAPGDVVVDVACGPGSVTRIAAEAAGADGRVIGCDISEGMLEVARMKPPLDEECAPIEYHQAPADALPVEDASADVVLCQQGLQFFPDKVAAVTEMHRVLRPGGRLGIAVWASIDGTPVFKVLADAVEAVCGEEVASRYRGGPWGFPEIAPLGAVIREAGFLDVHLEMRELALIFPGGVDQLYATLRFSGIVSDLAERDEAAVARLRETVEEGLAPFLVNDEIRSYARSHVARAVR
jgi:SAM-dependent methyltransferase